MKIDFKGSYRDVIRFLDAPNGKSSKTSEDFSSLLSSLSPHRDQAVVINKDITPPLQAHAPAISQDSGPMASLKIPVTELIPPLIEELGVPVDQPPEVNEAAPGVKKPTIIGATRVPGKTRIEVSEIKSLVQRAGEKHGVDPSLGMAMISAESSFNPTAVSRDGHHSKGLFQLLDSTGQDAMGRLGMQCDYDPFNPELNVELGLGHLRYLHQTFSQSTKLAGKISTVAAANSSSLEKLAVAAFNAGEGRVAIAQQRAQAAGLNPAHYEQIANYLPETTRSYVTKVVGLKRFYSGDIRG